MNYTRRAFGLAAMAALPLTRAFAAKINSKFDGVQLGAQSYSFRDMPLDAALNAMKQIGIGECELFMGHVEPKGMKGEELKQWRLTTPMSYFTDVKKKVSDAGIQLYAYTLNFKNNWSDEELDRGFQMTKALGTDIITTSTTIDCAKRLAPLAEKYKVKVAMHGHDNVKDPQEFAKPESFAAAMAMSKMFYINLDIGHFTAANYDPIEYIQQHHDKILSLHIKDRKKDHGPNMPLGEGDTPIKAVLQLLKTKKYPIPANIEYEYGKPGMDTIAEVRKCFEYCKAQLA